MHIPVVGIVAEYNPLHRGHEHHIKEAAAMSKAEAVVAVLSSDFVQRGEPSIVNKWKRAEMALCSGVDLVLELPSIFSSHNAGVFANAAVDILGATKKVTHIAYGVESNDRLSDKIVDIVIEEPKPFKFLLKEHLSKGYSFVESRSLAIDAIIPGAAKILHGSNNSLAMAYLTRIKKKKYDITPLPVQRIGASYNDDSLGNFSSATAIRKAVSLGDIKGASCDMPLKTAEILAREIESGHAYTDSSGLWRMLRTLLLRASPAEIAQMAEIGEGIEYKLRDAAYSASTFEEWASLCTSKRYPMGRIRRHAMHILLSFDHWTNRAAQRTGPAYIRVLAMNGKGRNLLREMRHTSALPIITKCGEAARISALADKIMSYDILASEIREGCVPNGEFGAEHARRIIITD